jgi:hypothetical protein
MQTELTSDERRMIIMALINPVFKAAVHESATPRKVRDIYKVLLDKLKHDEKLHMDLASSISQTIIMPK